MDNQTSTWTDLVAALRNSYRVVAAGDETLCIQLPRAPQRTQLLVISRAKVPSGDLVMTIELGSDAQFDIHAALGDAVLLPVGALIRCKATIGLRHILRGAWTVAAVEEALQLLSAGARRLSVHASSRRTSAPVFENFAL